MITCKGKYHDPKSIRTVTYEDGRKVQMCKKCCCTIEDAEPKKTYNKAFNPLLNPFKD